MLIFNNCMIHFIGNLMIIRINKYAICVNLIIIIISIFVVHRILIAILSALVIIATIFDFVKYSEHLTWQWNQGNYNNII